jgi:plastocyanin
MPAVLAAFFALTAPYPTSAHESGQTSQAAASSKTSVVEIDNFKFSVATLEVAAGTTVTWTNHDDVPHTVVSTTKLFKSAPLDTGESFTYTFKDAGTFEYFCSLHPRMTGKVVVK